MSMVCPDRIGSIATDAAADGPRMRDCMKLLRERFPHTSPVTLHRLQTQETFRELCEEYLACVRSVERLAHVRPEDSLRAEYSALSLRLEGEMLRYIAEHGGSSSP